MIGEMNNHSILGLYKEMGKDFCPNFTRHSLDNIDTGSLWRKIVQFKERLYGENLLQIFFEIQEAHCNA